MSIEELNEALTDEAVYGRRKIILDALTYEMELLDQALTLLEPLDDMTTAAMTEAQTEKLSEDHDVLEETHSDLDNAHTAVIQSLNLDQIKRYNEESTEEFHTAAK